MPPGFRRSFGVFCIGVTQLVHWGVSYYLIGAFGGRIAAEMGWSSARVHSGYSLALLVMGVLSAPVGRWIDRRGGRLPMSLGAALTAAACCGLMLCRDFATYLAVWAVLGAAMRLTLYDAAFAALAKAFGSGAKRPIAQITLLGGLASTVFWPFGNWLAELWGWRVAVGVYGGIALASIPLFWVLPAALPPQPAAAAEAAPEVPPPPPPSRLAAVLFAFTVGGLNFLNSAMSAHMIGLLAGLGMALPVAVWVASFRGIGQSAARLMEILFGGRLHPLDLHLAAAIALPLSFAMGGASGLFLSAAMVYSGLYGISNGLMTITRGTLPLVLFDPARYGATVGRLLTPGFLVAAAAPALFAAVIDAAGPGAAMALAAGLAVSIAAAAVALRRRFYRPL
ncbi:MFS transporter [Oleispirillum naphthae]|uniref:MFS transporter n=1 Tax=Oleispirillum naphthae TaxID=2838853 RepID=UPI0030823EF7